MLVFSALVAGSFSLGSMAANEIAPAALNAVRFAIAAVVIGSRGAGHRRAAARGLAGAVALSGAGRAVRDLFRADVRGAEDRAAGQSRRRSSR